MLMLFNRNLRMNCMNHEWGFDLKLEIRQRTNAEVSRMSNSLKGIYEKITRFTDLIYRGNKRSI
jgi:hypothetical protein